MASSGKKGKKKWKSLALDEFMDSGPTRKVNWADEVDRELDDASSDYIAAKSTNVVLPTAPRASRAANIDESKIPTNGPFFAFVSNIPYEMNEDEIAALFKDLKIKGVRLPREDKGGNRARGFGYIEFEDRANLIAALNQGQTMVKGRQLHMEVATGSDAGRGGGRGGGRGPRDGGPRDAGGPDRTSGNWRSGPRSEEYDDRGGGYDRGQYGGGGRREFGGSGFSRGGGGGGGGFEERGGFGREERSSFHREESRGFGGSREERFGGREDSSSSPMWRSEERKDIGRDRDRERDRDRDRDRDGRFGPPKREEQPPPRGEPKVRTKLHLQPRSNTATEPSEGGGGASNTSIFGGAKPVDTSARDREIEERLAKHNEELGRSHGSSGSKDKDWQEEKKIEPAPLPKDNAWSARRANQPPPVNNGRSSPDDEGQMEGVHRDDRQDVNEKRVDHSEPKRLETKRSDDRSRGVGAQKSGERTKVREPERHSNKQRDPRRETGDEISRMPKVQETTAPNFAGENKFSSLEADEAYVD